MTLAVGQMAPDFSLPNQLGELKSLSQYLGKWVLVYFYPKDDTPGCTKEACAIRDNFPDFAALGIQVLGISADSVQSHQKFSKKYSLPFELLSDGEKTAITTYGAWGERKMMGRSFEGIMRMSYLIDPEGKIAQVYEKVKPAEHADEVLAFLRSK